MVAAKRNQTAAVADVLGEPVWDWCFFQAVRRLESVFEELPRTGYSLHPSEEPLRFGQSPTLAFPPSELASLREQESMPPRLLVHFLGLLGCNGPMPLYFTEYVWQRIAHSGDHTLAAFLDTFHHRMICLYYRAWAMSQQTVSHDREDDPFGVYFASLLGMGAEPLRNRDAVVDAAKFHYSGQLGSRPAHAHGLVAILEGYFGVPVTIREFIGQWLSLPKSSRCRMGESRDTGLVGRTAIVGSRIWDRQQRFRMRFGPMSLKRYIRLLPKSDGLKRLKAWVRSYVGLELEWEAQLVLRADEVPSVELGGGNGAALGYTTWLQSLPRSRDADDLVLGPFDRGVVRIE